MTTKRHRGCGNKKGARICPRNPRQLIRSIATNSLDHRTSHAKNITEIQGMVRDNLDETAQALLEFQVAALAEITQYLFQYGMANPNGIINKKGNVDTSLNANNFLAYAGALARTLKDLKKFQGNRSKPNKNDPADLVIEASKVLEPDAK